MLRNGIKPMKPTFIFSSLVNIFLLVRMFFGCYQLCEGSGEDYQEIKGVKNGEGAHTVKEKVNWIQVAQYLWGSFNWEQIPKATTHVAAERADRISYLAIKMLRTLGEVAA